ncbi:MULTISPECIES: hypothetical protein [unclassified Streptomyces]|uniref:hypothetical protein n=1 Tax=unclassified Streptomyces TaxID=2593676 RepID=UPI00225A45CA|nr:MULTISPECIES: hypothetical protein [unclassified Streptomyces]MCX5336358.1 hypothetical protein [Streptomyces sp. NBC_00140]MCX5367079.1 hypothetical protein [Streptomyces sp. NBC_00124]
MTPWNNENLSSCAYADPYAAPDPQDNTWPAPDQACDDLDYFLPPPNPAERLNWILDPRDERRLALNATLTAAGIPPMPEDRAVIDQLSALPADVSTVLQRWLHHAL